MVAQGENETKFRIRTTLMENMGDFLNTVILPVINNQEPAYYTFFPPEPTTSWFSKIKKSFF